MKKKGMEMEWLVALIFVVVLLLVLLIIIWLGRDKMGQLADRIFDFWRFGG